MPSRTNKSESFGLNPRMHFESRMEKLFKGVYSSMYRGHRVEIELRPLADFSYNALYCCCKTEGEESTAPVKETEGSRQIRTVDEYQALLDEMKSRIDALVDGSKGKPKKAAFSFQYRIRT